MRAAVTNLPRTSDPRALQKPTSPLTLVAVAVTWIGLAIFMASRVFGKGLDDVFITYRYAANLLAGHGFVFNPGESVLATTAPGFALLLAGLGWLTDLPLPWLGTILTGVALLALTGIVGLTLVRAGRPWEALVAGTLVLGFDFTWTHAGNEIAPALALLLGAAAVAAPGRRDFAAALLAGAATWLRPDLGLGALALAVVLAGERRRLPWRFGLLFSTVVVIGLGLAWWAFGSPLPVTLAAKRAQAMALPELATSGWEFWPTALAWLARWLGPSTLPLATLGLLGIGAGWSTAPRTVRTLWLTATFTAFAFPLLRVPFATWYTIGPVLALTVGLVHLPAGGEHWLHRASPASRRPWILGLAAGVLIATVLVPAIVATAGRLRVPQPFVRGLLYDRVGTYLARHSQPGDLVAAAEVGILGYTSGLAVLDLAGLVTPRSLPALLDHRMPELVGRERPRWLVHHLRVTPFSAPILAAPHHAGTYREVWRTGGRVPGEEIVLFERQSRQPGGNTPEGSASP